MLTIERISNIDDMKRFKPVWDKLLKRTSHNLIFLSYDFIIAEWENIGWERSADPPPSPFILVVREADEIIGIFPLMKLHTKFYGLPITMVTSLGDQYLTQDMIISKNSDDILDKVLEYLRMAESSWNLLSFRNVAVDSLLVANVAKALRDTHPVGFKSGNQSPYLRKQGDWSAYIKARSKNYHKRLNNKTNGLTRNVGEIVAREYRSPEAAAQGLEVAFEIDAKSWKAQEGTAISSTERSKKYWKSLTSRLAAQDRVRIWILWTGSRAIAFEYHAIYNSIVYSMKWSYDKEYQQYSPGMILKHRSMESFWNEDIIGIDLLGSCDDFKEQWAKEKRLHTNIYIFNQTFYSKLLHWIEFRFLALIKNMRNSMHGLYATGRSEKRRNAV
jgi:CelD/BcsL family acetyltransferase involved in cellulose biosynthesis